MTIDYKKHFGPGGTVYRQTITINDKMAIKFNKYLQKEKEKIINNFIYTNEQLDLLSIEPLEMGANYTHLPTINHFTTFYVKNFINGPKKDKNFQRILFDRNTIINVI